MTSYLAPKSDTATRPRASTFINSQTSQMLSSIGLITSLQGNITTLKQNEQLQLAEQDESMKSANLGVQQIDILRAQIKVLIDGLGRAGSIEDQTVSMNQTAVVVDALGKIVQDISDTKAQIRTTSASIDRKRTEINNNLKRLNEKQVEANALSSTIAFSSTSDENALAAANPIQSASSTTQ